MITFLAPRSFLKLICVILGLAAFSVSAAALAEDVWCRYRDSAGKTAIASSYDQVPQSQKFSAICFRNDPQLAKPQEIKLKGSARQAQFVSPLGPVDLRWPRSVEDLFGRSPERAMVSAAQTASKALRMGAFPPSLKGLHQEWSVVFLDANLPETQIPSWLRNNCHPGWMTPPGNIYIVGQRITSGCGGARNSASKVGDAQLEEVLVHELGHAIEFQLINGYEDGDRARSEGFATWFEGYAANYSGFFSRGQVEARLRRDAQQAQAAGASWQQFSGSGADYAYAAQYFNLLVARRGISSLVNAYQRLSNQRTNFLTQLKSELAVNDTQLDRELERYLK